MNYIEHGLDSTPKMVIYKLLNGSQFWPVQHDGITTNGGLILNTTDAQSGPFTYDFFDNTATSIGVRSNYAISSNSPYIAYCFAEVEGFSSFGSYVGNGTTSNNIVTGFEPAFLMTKRTDVAGYNWYLWDNKRSPTNPRDKVFDADRSGAEQDFSAYPHNFLSNGFSVNTDNGAFNASGGTYIYMAFAADPTAVEPTLADSFNTVLYSGNSGTQSITGVGFQPDFLWIKSRNATYNNLLQDSVRGAGSSLYSNLTYSGDDSGNYYVSSFNSNGFTMNVLGGSSQNNTGTNYVAWNWKGAEIPVINSNGSIKSVVSANPAAGFSIVSYTGNNIAGATIGHGLGDAPSIVIVKTRNAADYWCVGGSVVGNGQNLYLNDAGAKLTRDRVTSVQTNTFTLGSHFEVNTTNNYIAYCFAEVAEFSKFGSYTGTGASGNTVTVGFEPAFVIIKRTDASGGSWGMYDNKRGVGEPSKVLYANLSAAEYADNFHDINFVGNTFVLLDNSNNTNFSGATYIYMAFANQF